MDISGISWIKINPENSLLRQHDSSMMSAGQPGLSQVQPDVRGPHVSDTGTNPGQTQRWLGFDPLTSSARQVGPMGQVISLRLITI